jgi:hypothetical protein
MAPGIEVLEELERRRVDLGVETDGAQENPERIAHGFVVVYEVDERTLG